MKNVRAWIEDCVTDAQDSFTPEVENLEQQAESFDGDCENEEKRDFLHAKVESMNLISKILGEIRDGKHPHITDIFEHTFEETEQTQSSLDKLHERMEECVNFIEDCEQGLEMSEETISVQVALMEAAHRFYSRMKKYLERRLRELEKQNLQHVMEVSSKEKTLER